MNTNYTLFLLLSVCAPPYFTRVFNFMFCCYFSCFCPHTSYLIYHLLFFVVLGQFEKVVCTLHWAKNCTCQLSNLPYGSWVNLVFFVSVALVRFGFKEVRYTGQKFVPVNWVTYLWLASEFGLLCECCTREAWIQRSALHWAKICTLQLSNLVAREWIWYSLWVLQSWGLVPKKCASMKVIDEVDLVFQLFFSLIYKEFVGDNFSSATC